MAYFTKDFIEFFKELSNNNHKEWFDENRKRYTKVVKEPFFDFVSQMIARVNSDDPSITLQTKDAIFRINRDIRFSKDKTPYKTHVSAAIAKGGKKDYTNPGLYFELRADGISIYSGVFQAEKEGIYKIRKYISENPEQLNEAINDPDFKENYGEILGDKNKVLPKEFKHLVDEIPLLANKQFYYKADLPKRLITSDDLADKIFETYLASRSVKDFFTKALNS